MIEQMKNFIKNLPTPIAIVGMGKSGEAAYKLLTAAGVPPHHVTTFDDKLSSARYTSPESLMTEFAPKTLVVSPGVPLSSPWLQKAKSQNVHITSELSLACAFLENEKLIGVTGSVGKSTTVSILGAGLEAFSPSAFVGGNLGVPLAEYALSILSGSRSRADWIILELSSYQLENCTGLELDYAAITYFTANHLERYASLNEYYETKWRILSLTKEKLLINAEGGDLLEFCRRKRSEDKVLTISKNSEHLKPFHLSKALLIGSHNQDNLALAAALALEAGWPFSSIEQMKSFKGLAHRLENVATIKGVRFINDSKATAMDSVLIAARAASESRMPHGHLYILLGGRDKNLPWELLHQLHDLPDSICVFFGECREIAQKKSRLKGASFSTLGEAFDFVSHRAKSSDTVLLSPGGTSLDEFKNFEERGDFFKRKVKEFANRP